MAVDFGTSAAGISDLGGRVSYATGLTCLGQDLAKRLMTPRGALSWDPNCGYDTRALLMAGQTPAQIFQHQAEIERECEKDSRVQTCSALLTFAATVLTITLTVTTASGTFPLVLAVTKLSVTLLNANT